MAPMTLVRDTRPALVHHGPEWYRIRTGWSSRRLPLELYPAWQQIQGLSTPRKMPGTSYSLPGGRSCLLGQKLGCAAYCYARKGNYVYPDVVDTLQRRQESLRDLTGWSQAMIQILNWYGSIADPHVRYHRWHDSGELQSPEHLQAIIRVARSVPGLHFWLPTRAYNWVRANQTPIPDNLTIRLSSPTLDKPISGMVGSMIHTRTPPAGVYVCPAQAQGNRCGSCRACWDPGIRTVSYHMH